MSDTLEFSITERKIDGQVYMGDQNTTPQITKDQFLFLLDRVLNLPRVKAVVWDQYTPYFNDGDACIFSVREPRIIFEGGVSTDEDDEDDVDLFNGYREYGTGYSASELWKALPGVGYDYWLPGRAGLDLTKVTFTANDGQNYQDHYEALKAFAQTDSWERVALTNFGDHAEVTATKDGFSVETYEHD